MALPTPRLRMSKGLRVLARVIVAVGLGDIIRLLLLRPFGHHTAERSAAAQNLSGLERAYAPAVVIVELGALTLRQGRSGQSKHHRHHQRHRNQRNDAPHLVRYLLLLSLATP